MIEYDDLSAEGSWSQLDAASSDFLQLAVSCSDLTIPNFIHDGDDIAISVENDLFTNVGTRSYEEFISRLLYALFPPAKNFFYLSPNRAISEEVSAASGEEGRTLLEKDLMIPVSECSRLFDSMRMREDIQNALKIAGMGGGSLLRIDFEDTQRCQAYTLNNYKCIESPLTKDIIEFVIREVITYSSLEKEVVDQLEGVPEDLNETIELYTHGIWDNETEKYYVYQEIGGKKIEESKKEYQRHNLPYIHVVVNQVLNTSYGLGLVHGAYYDLVNLNQLNKNLVDQAAINSTQRFFVDPTGLTRLQDFLNSKNGDAIRGRAQDITAMQAGAMTQQQTTLAYSQHLEANITKYFMSKQVDYGNRDRVTRTEIMANAEAIDASQGGLYSSIAARLQYKIAMLLLDNIGADSGVFNNTELKIITGLQAINQGREAVALDGFVESLSKIAQYFPDIWNTIDANEYVKRSAVANQIDPSGLIKTQQQMQQEQMQAQQQQLQMQTAQGLVEGATNADAAAMQQMAEQNPEQTLNQ